MSDGDLLLRAILDAPDDDGARLVYADWLEEAGQKERGEFIRVQCHIAAERGLACGRTGTALLNYGEFVQRCRCGPCSLRRREYNCSKRHIVWDWLGGVVGWNHFVTNKDWRRGFVHTVHCTLAEWCGATCWECIDAGAARPYCSECRGVGHSEGHGKAIVRGHPIERAEAMGHSPEPHTWAGGTNYSWYVDGFQDDHATVPEEIFDLLPDAWTGLSGGRKAYPTERAARDALSAALLAFARS